MPIGGEVGRWLEIIAEHNRRMRELAEKQDAGKKLTNREQDYLDNERLWKIIGRGLEERIGTAVERGMGQARALASRGFSGTAEQAQQSYAMEMLGRQFAGVMKPVFDALTYFAVEVERRMRAFGGNEQNRLMGAAIGTAVGYKLLGAPGAILGGAVGMLAGGNGPYDTAIGAGAGAYAGFRLAGLPGAAVGGAVGAVAGSGDYGRLRAEGNSKFASAVGSGIGALTDLGHAVFGPGGLGFGSGPNPMDAIRAEADAKRAKTAGEARRDVTPFQVEQMEAGGTAQLIQQALIRATAGAGYEETGPFKPIIEVLLAILDQLIRMSGGTPPPRSATEAA